MCVVSVCGECVLSMCVCVCLSVCVCDTAASSIAYITKQPAPFHVVCTLLLHLKMGITSSCAVHSYF